MAEFKLPSGWNLPGMDLTPQKVQKIESIPAAELHHYENHVFQLYEDERKSDMIESIKENDKNVAVLIIPKERSAEWTAAYTDIGTENVARIIELDKGQKYRIINGTAILTDEETNGGEIFIVNGSCILETRENVPELYVNGMLIKRKSARCKLISLNGQPVEIADDAVLKTYPVEAVIDRDTIKNLPEKTALVAGVEIKLKSDIFETELLAKKIKFYAGVSIECPKGIYGYANANSQVGVDIQVTDE